MKNYIHFWLIVILFFLSCEDRIATRNNPYDPSNPDYIFSSLSGRILDSRNNFPIQDCKIILEGEDTVFSNNEGEYSFESIVHGSYNITIEKNDYLSHHDSINIEYNSNGSYSVNIINDSPYLLLSDSSLIFLSEEISQDLIIYNDGTQILDWEFNYEQESIFTNVINGSISPNQQQEIMITIDKHLLDIGNHNIPINIMSNGGNKTINLNIDVEPFLVVTPDSLEFDFNTLNGSFELTNPGGGILDFTINENITWLTLSQYEGQIGGEILLVESTVDTNYLIEGNNSGTINISSEYGSVTIISSIYVPFPPFLELSDEILEFGLDSESLSFSIINEGDGILSWNISQTDIWFNVSPENGETSDEEIVYVTVDRSLLYEGSYDYDLQINSNVQNEEIEITLDVLPILQVSESVLNFGASSNDLSFLISNIGNGIMPWSINASDNWILLSETSGSTTEEIVTINVGVDQSNLESGTHNSSIIISSEENEHIIHVEVYVPLPPLLEVSETEFEINNDDMYLYISNGGEGELEWSISEQISWLSISPISGITTLEQHQVILTPNTEYLQSGQYNDSFLISSNGGDEVINVNMFVVNPFYENFEDLSDWSGDIVDDDYGDGWNITGSGNCLSGACATVYFCSVCEETDVQISRQIFVESGMELQIYTFTYWAFDLKIYLGGSLILQTSTGYGVQNLSHTITFTGQTELRMVSEYNYLGSGYIDELTIE